MKKKNYRSMNFDPNYRYPIGDNSKPSMTGPNDVYYNDEKINKDKDEVVLMDQQQDKKKVQMNQEKIEIYKEFFLNNLFEFYWIGDVELYQKIDDNINDKQNFIQVLNTYFNNDIFKKEVDIMDEENPDRIRGFDYTIELMDRVIVKYRAINK